MLVVLWVLVPSREISMQMFPFDAIANFHVMASLNVPVFRETGASCQKDERKRQLPDNFPLSSDKNLQRLY